MDAQDLLIHNFFDNAVVNDFARDYLFRVTALKFSGTAGNDGADLALNDLLYAKTAKLPARSIVNQPVKYSGQTFNVPGSVEYPGSENFAIEFYCPEYSFVREKLMNESVRTFSSFDGVAGSGNSGGSIANRDSYIELTTFSKNYESIYKYKLIGCSIREVGEVAYNIAEGNGAVMSFTVGVAYHMFTRSLDTNIIVPRGFSKEVYPNDTNTY
jgi:hypothetical protein